MGTSWTQYNAEDGFSIDPVWSQEGCRKDVNKIKGRVEHLGSKQHIKYVRRRKNNGKYLQISNCIFTMKGLTDKKIILRRFFRTGLLCLHEKFQVYQSSPSGFVKKCQIFDHICVKKYFSIKIFAVLHQSKKELLDLDKNWAKTRHLLFKT